jgi:ABC-type sugar transport system ATPase subunit
MIEAMDIHIKQGNFELENLSFSIETGEYACLIGQTGTGKTTILEAICGLKSPKVGSFTLKGKNITLLKPAERKIGFVPQDGALFETMTVSENISFALRIRKWSKQDREKRAEELAELLSISHLLDRMPENLSGGEKQRVALGRALSFYPSIICLDEPMSALDDQTKLELYKLIKDIRKELTLTALHITHNIEEVEQLADKVLHLKDGVLKTYSKIDFMRKKNDLIFSNPVTVNG